MTNIDGSKGAGNTNATNRTDRSSGTQGPDGTEAANESDATSETRSGSTRTPPDPDEVDRFRRWSGGGDGRSGPRQPVDGDSEATPAHLLRAERRGADDEMAERKEQLGETLDRQYEKMGVDWDADEGFWNKSVSAWKRAYTRSTGEGPEATGIRDAVGESLAGDGRPMSDADIQEVVDAHRERLEDRGAFEGFSPGDVENWEAGLTSHLKQQRAEQAVEQFEPAPIDDLPTPSRELDERQFDNPDEIRRKLDEWENENLEKLDEIADEVGLEGRGSDQLTHDLGDPAYTAERDRIQDAREAYEMITVGDEDGTEYAFPEDVDADRALGPARPREAYISHLEDNPGDIMGAYREAEEILRTSNWDMLADMLAAGAA